MNAIRRNFLVGVGATLVLTACGPGGPGSITINAQGSAGMNPGPDGTDRPLTLTIVQMKGPGAFDAADYYALQDPANALGGDLLKTDQLVVEPGKATSKAIALEVGATVVGVIAGYRSPAGKAFRAKTAAKNNAKLNVSVGSGGIQLAPA
ncbi:MAG: type VI secretion system lipoprotein TssJ [Paracoccaceae bacterium]